MATRSVYHTAYFQTDMIEGIPDGKQLKITANLLIDEDGRIVLEETEIPGGLPMPKLKWDHPQILQGFINPLDI